MSTVMHPVGPQEPRVYWVRRILLALVVAVLAFGLLRFLGGRSDSGTPQGAPTPVVTKPAATPTKVTPSPTNASPTKTTSTPAACADSTIAVVASTDKPSYPAGATPVLKMRISTTGKVACTRDVGPPANTLLIVKGTALTWSSDHCNPGGAPNVVMLSPGQTYSVTVTWNQQTSAVGCPTGQPRTAPGSYELFGKNGSVRTTGATFRLG